MTVFANKLEVACKAQANKVIAAMPDVCFTPPEAPPTPPGVPIPYPSFGLDGDTDKGTGTVKIGGKTISHKNKSHYTKTTGTEAGVAAKKGVVTSKNTGKSYSQAWSSNVKAEGQPVCRFSDISTNNHGSFPGNAPPWPKIGQPHVPNDGDLCDGEKERAAKACEDPKYQPTDKDKAEGITTPHAKACKEAGLKLDAKDKNNDGSSSHVKRMVGGVAKVVKGLTGKTSELDTSKGHFRVSKKRDDQWAAAQEEPCLAARRCMLVSKEDSDKKEKHDKEKGCCGGQTGHHLIPKSSMVDTNEAGNKVAGTGEYDPQKAPCICAEGASSTKGSHGMMHNYVKVKICEKTSLGGDLPMADGTTGKDRVMNYDDQREHAVNSVAAVFPESNCSAACLEAQLNGYHTAAVKDGGCGMDEKQPLKASAGPGRGEDEARNALKSLDDIDAKIKRARS